ncbi:phage tail protein [Bacillus cereus]|uniref:phage tail protein n=1 Tax=Bacillus cereus TaxID=1396 RepID=UPI000BF4EFA4|nr:phage tail protein [Bacillus cereus]PEQ68967.1 phage tail protein [Bacillus cereus]
MSNVGKTTIEIIADSKKARQAFFELQKVMDKGTADFGRRLKRNNPFKILEQTINTASKNIETGLNKVERKFSRLEAVVEKAQNRFDTFKPRIDINGLQQDLAAAQDGINSLSDSVKNFDTAINLQVGIEGLETPNHTLNDLEERVTASVHSISQKIESVAANTNRLDFLSKLPGQVEEKINSCIQLLSTLENKVSAVVQRINTTIHSISDPVTVNVSTNQWDQLEAKIQHLERLQAQFASTQIDTFHDYYDYLNRAATRMSQTQRQQRHVQQPHQYTPTSSIIPTAGAGVASISASAAAAAAVAAATAAGTTATAAAAAGVAAARAAAAARKMQQILANMPEHLKAWHTEFMQMERDLKAIGRAAQSLDQMADAAVRNRVSLDRMMSANSAAKGAAKDIQNLNSHLKETQLAILGLNKEGKIRISAEESQAQLAKFRQEVAQTRVKLRELRDAGYISSYEAGNKALQKQLSEIRKAMSAAAMGGNEYNAMLQRLGVHTQDAANRMVIMAETQRNSFMHSIQMMNAMKTQSQKMMDALGDTSHIQRIDRAFLQVGHRLETMAKHGSAAHIALSQLGPNASMKALQDRVALINMGILRMQQVAIYAGVALLGFTTIMAKASFGPSPADVRKQQAEIKAEYDKAYQQRLDQIYNFADMFKKVERKTFDKKELIKNLNDQAAYMETWVTDLSKLADRAPKAFVQELRKMGPEAAGEVHTLTKMTEKELNEYVKAWEHKVYMANVAVKDELEDMRKAAEAQIKELQDSLKPLGIAWERFIATWGKAAEPFVETWGQIAAKVLDVGTAIGDLIVKLNELNPSISAAAGNFMYLMTAMTFLLAPMAIGIGRADGMKAAFSALWVVISDLTLGLLRIAGMASVISAAIVIVVGSLMKMWDASEKLRNAVTNGWDEIKSAFSEGFNSVQGDSDKTVSVWRQMGDALAGVVDFMVMCIKPFAEIFGGIVATTIEWAGKLSGTFSKVPEGAQHYQDLKDKAILHMMELRTKTGEEAEKAKSETIQAFQEMTNEVIKELDGKKGQFETMFAQLMGVVPESAQKTLETVKNNIVDSINKQIDAAKTANKVLMEGVQKYQGDISKMPKDFAEQYRQAIAVADNNIKLFYDKASQLTGLVDSINKGGLLSVEAGKKKLGEIMTTFKDGMDGLTKQTDEMRERIEKEYNLGKINDGDRKATLDAIDLYEKKHVMDLIGIRNEGTKALENNLKAEDAALVLANPRKKELEKAAWYEKYKELLFGAETYGEAMSRFNSEQDKAEKSHKEALANYEKQYGREKIENINQYTAELSKGTTSSIMLAETMAKEIDGKMKVDLGPAGTFTVKSFVDKLKSGELQANDVAVANANKLKDVYKVDLSESGIASMQTFTQAMVGKDTSEIKQALGIKLSNDTNIDLGIYGQMTIGTWIQGLQNGTLSFDTVFQYFQQQVKNGVKVDATAEGQANIQTLVNGMNIGALSVSQVAQLIGLNIKSNASVDLGAEGTFTVQTLIQGMQNKQIDAQTAAMIIKELIANGAKLDATQIGSDISNTLGYGLGSNPAPVNAANQQRGGVEGALAGTSDGGGGAKSGTNLGDGILSKRGYIKGSALDVVAAAQEGMNTINGNPAGQKGGNEFAQGIGSQKGNAQNNAQQNANAAHGGFGTINGDPFGLKGGSGFANGLMSTRGQAQNAGSDVASAGERGLKSSNTESLGSHFASGFSSGIRSGKSLAQSAGEALASTAFEAARRWLEVRSPSRKVKREIGFHFGTGFAAGIGESTKTVVIASRNLAQSAFSMLDSFTGAADGSSFVEPFVDNVANMTDRVMTHVQTFGDTITNVMDNVKDTLSQNISGNINFDLASESIKRTLQNAQMNLSDKFMYNLDGKIPSLSASSVLNLNKIITAVQPATSDNREINLTVNLTSLMDGREVAKITEPYTTEIQRREKEIRDQF